MVNLADIAQLVPTLTVSSNLSPFATGIRIRGIGTSQNTVALEASVAFVVDGVYLGRSGLGMSDLTDIERIEVLQGPQGTLYGKNANAGVISVVTRNPDFEETGGYVQATAGDYGLQQYTASLTGPVNDEFAYLLAGNWRQQDGWLENDTGPDQMSEDNWNLRGKLQWQPSDALSIMLTGSHVDRDDRCCAADALQTDSFLALLAANGLPVPKNDAFDWKNNADQSSEFTMTSDMAILTVDYELDQFQLTSLSAWNDYDYKSSADADRSQFDILYFVDDKYGGSAFSQEFRLSSDLDGPLQYLGGLYYLHEENNRDNPEPFTFLGDDIVSVGRVTFGPQIALIAAPGDYIAATGDFETDAWAAFGQTTYSFTEEWLLTVGLRYTDEEKSVDGYVENLFQLTRRKYSRHSHLRRPDSHPRWRPGAAQQGQRDRADQPALLCHCGHHAIRVCGYRRQVARVQRARRALRQRRVQRGNHQQLRVGDQEPAVRGSAEVERHGFLLRFR